MDQTEDLEGHMDLEDQDHMDLEGQGHMDLEDQDHMDLEDQYIMDHIIIIHHLQEKQYAVVLYHNSKVYKYYIYI